MESTLCADRVVGAILASWRYDISGIPKEMRRDYELHFAECPHCRAKQKFHRGLDVTLVALTALLVLGSPIVLVILGHTKPLEHATFNIPIPGLALLSPYQLLIMAAIVGFGLSVTAFILVLMATPAPSYLGDIAAERVSQIKERLPEAIKAFKPQ